MRLTGSRYTTQPPRFVEIDRGSALCRGLVGAYLLNGNSGLLVRDSTLTANTTGILTFPLWNYGRAAQLNGTTSWALFTAGGVPSFSKAMPISGAFRFSCTSASNLTLASQFKVSVAGGWAARINGNTAGTFDFGFFNAGGTAGRQRFTTATFNDGKPHTGIFTYDGSDTVGGIHLYVDTAAERAASTGLNTDPGTNSGPPLAIGALTSSLGAPQQPFAGSIEFAHIWNRVLLPAEIDELMRNPYAVFAPVRKALNFYAPRPPATITLTCGTGSFALTGEAAIVSARRLLTAATGTFALTGEAANFPASLKLTAAAGSIALSGQAATLIAQRVIAAAQGSYTLTGESANLTAQRKVTAGFGSYSVTGLDAALTASFALALAHGAYALSGQAANLSVIRLLTAQQGAYSVTGQAASLNVIRLLQAGTGSYSLTGFAANVGRLFVLQLDTGAYALTGFDAQPSVLARVTTAAGNFALTGFSSQLTASLQIVLDRGIYALTGFDLATRLRKFAASQFQSIVPALDRRAVVPGYGRVALVEPYLRLSQVPATEKLATVPAVDRIATVPALNKTSSE